MDPTWTALLAQLADLGTAGNFEAVLARCEAARGEVDSGDRPLDPIGLSALVYYSVRACFEMKRFDEVLVHVRHPLAGVLAYPNSAWIRSAATESAWRAGRPVAEIVEHSELCLLLRLRAKDLKTAAETKLRLCNILADRKVEDAQRRRHACEGLALAAKSRNVPVQIGLAGHLLDVLRNGPDEALVAELREKTKELLTLPTATITDPRSQAVLEELQRVCRE